MDIGLFLSVMAASLLVAVVSLICTVFLYVSDSRLKIWMPRLIAIAVGVLLGDAFLHLIPDALDLAGGHQSSVYIEDGKTFIAHLLRLILRDLFLFIRLLSCSDLCNDHLRCIEELNLPTFGSHLLLSWRALFPSRIYSKPSSIGRNYFQPI